MGEVVDRGTGEILSHAAVINRLHDLAQSSAVQAIQYAIQCGEELQKQKAQLAHGEWKLWVEANCTFSYRSAAIYMKAAEQKCRGLHFSSLNALYGPDKGNHLVNGTGENEWYTPADVIARVYGALGGIDLDPASNEEANETVGADRYFTAEDDGLTREWNGRVWLNPPYSRELMPAFVSKLIAEYQSGRVTDAMLVSHNNTETAWFQSLALVASAICFPSARIKFYRGDDVAAPVNGQAFFYVGSRIADFCREFSDMGVIMAGINDH